MKQMAANIALTKFSAERIAIEIKASWKQERQRILVWRRRLRPVMSDDISLSFLFFKNILFVSSKCPENFHLRNLYVRDAVFAWLERTRIVRKDIY